MPTPPARDVGMQTLCSDTVHNTGGIPWTGSMKGGVKALRTVRRHLQESGCLLRSAWGRAAGTCRITRPLFHIVGSTADNVNGLAQKARDRAALRRKPEQRPIRSATCTVALTADRTACHALAAFDSLEVGAEKP